MSSVTIFTIFVHFLLSSAPFVNGGGGPGEPSPGEDQQRTESVLPSAGHHSAPYSHQPPNPGPNPNPNPNPNPSVQWKPVAAARPNGQYPPSSPYEQPQSSNPFVKLPQRAQYNDAVNPFAPPPRPQHSVNPFMEQNPRPPHPRLYQEVAQQQPMFNPYVQPPQQPQQHQYRPSYGQQPAAGSPPRVGLQQPQFTTNNAVGDGRHRPTELAPVVHSTSHSNSGPSSVSGSSTSSSSFVPSAKAMKTGIETAQSYAHKAVDVTAVAAKAAVPAVRAFTKMAAPMVEKAVKSTAQAAKDGTMKETAEKTVKMARKGAEAAEPLAKAFWNGVCKPTFNAAKKEMDQYRVVKKNGGGQHGEVPSGKK